MFVLGPRQRKQKKKEVNSVQNCSLQWEKKAGRTKTKTDKKVSGEREQRGDQTPVYPGLNQERRTAVQLSSLG